MSEEEIAQEDFRAAWLAVARLYLLDPEARRRFGTYRPIRADAGGWGQVEVRRIDPGPEARAAIERAEAEAGHLDDIEAGGPNWRWADDGL